MAGCSTADNRRITRRAIGAAIRKVRKCYVDEGLAPSFWAINNGLCDDFAHDVIAVLGGEQDRLYDVEDANFKEDGDFMGSWDWPLLRRYWNIGPPDGLTEDEVDNIEIGAHTWVTDRKRHYDAECPEGVENFFDLPLFRYCLEHRRLRDG